eukprot:TRINITY_DN5361_c0_g1_i1.p3 TRINITY_DN5361_c0_g1~~TRINITY_DN5361_c0_g1_i1.p3  ORF type:complete len:188 (+),score=100.08 TRINITY_DN5361_c0_g1_i1:521-1084(+)
MARLPAANDGEANALFSDVKIIDTEFAFYGPVAFDLGLFTAHMLVALLAARAHGAKAAYERYLRVQLRTFWREFVQRYDQLWRDAGESVHDATCRPSFVGGVDALVAVQAAHAQSTLADALGFASLEMIRRVVGIAHADDVDGIIDDAQRIVVEKRILRVGMRLLADTASFRSIDRVLELVDAIIQE